MRQVKKSHLCGATALLSLAAALVLTPAGASPLVDSRVGGLGLIGPASPHLASVYYNPAALELSPGHHIVLDSTVRLGHGAYERALVDPTTGEPSGKGFASSEGLLEVFPQLFLGLSSDLGSDSVKVAVYACTPVARRMSLVQGEGLSSAGLDLRDRSADQRTEVLEELFDPRSQGAARYQAVDFTLYHLNVTVAASYAIIDELVLGVSMSYVFGLLDLGFVRDRAPEGGSKLDPDKGEYVALDDCGAGTACNYENAAAAEAVRVSGSSHSIAFSAGILARLHPDVDVGAGYTSRVYGAAGDSVQTSGDAWVLRSPAAVDNFGSPAPPRDQVGRSTVTYSLPQMVHAGVNWRVRPWLALNGQFRWLHTSTHDRLVIRFTGTEFREEPRMPDRIVLYRGFQDVFAIQLGAGFRLGQQVVLQVATMLETSAVPLEATTVTTVDGVKLDSMVSLRWHMGGGFTLRAGYGLAAMPAAEVERSGFSPSKMSTCVDNRFNVDLQACKQSEQGRGLPSAAGSYTLLTHRMGLGLSYDVW